MNQLVVEGAGALDPEEWGRAWARVAEANPGAGSRLKGRWWVEGAPLPLRVVDSPWDGRGPHPALEQALDPRQGVCELVLWPRDRWVLRSHHGALDGRGTWLLAQELGRALRGEALLGSEAGPTRDVDLCAGGVAESEPATRYPGPTGAPSSTGLESTWARRRIQGLPRPLLGRVAAALYQVSRAWVEGPLGLSVSVDLRPRRPGLRSTANLSGILRLELGGQGAGEIQDALRGALHRGEERGLPLASAPLAALPTGVGAWLAGRKIRAQLREGRFSASASLSNLGLQDPAALAGSGFAPQRSFWIPPGHPSSPLFLTLTGDGEGVEVVGTAPRALAEGGRLEALLDGIVEAVGVP